MLVRDVEYREILRQLNVIDNKMNMILKNSGLVPDGDIKERVRTLTEQGMSKQNIANLLNVSVSCVANKRRELKAEPALSPELEAELSDVGNSLLFDDPELSFDDDKIDFGD